MIAYVLIEDINPIPWQSPDLGVMRSKSGKWVPTSTSPANMKAYKRAIQESVREAYPEYGEENTIFAPRTGLHVFFFYWRKLDQYTTKTGRKQTSHRADTSNINKVTEDALQGWLYHNDVDNITVLGRMEEQSADLETPSLLAVAADNHHHHVLPMLLDADFVVEFVEVLKQARPPMPPGNVRLRVIK